MESFWKLEGEAVSSRYGEELPVMEG